MKYLSVCSGIEAASVAWEPLGWSPVAFSEIEKFPAAVLAHHYGANMPGEPFTPNGVPNYGDMNNFKEWPDHGSGSQRPIDLLVGGTPCQSFSVAGLRKGLDDPRGNLTLVYLGLLARFRPRWCVWENVPGVLSSQGGRDFGAFVGGLAKLGYGFAWRVLDAQFVRVDGFPVAVPQRRRRVFVVGCLGDRSRAAAVLFDRESLKGGVAPRRTAGQEIACDVAPSLTASGRGFDRCGDPRGQDCLIPEVSRPLLSKANDSFGETLQSYIPEVANPLTARMAKGINTTLDERQPIFPVTVDVSDTLSVGANQTTGFPSEVVAIQERAVCENPAVGPDGVGVRGDGVAYTLEARTVPQAVTFELNQITSPTSRQTLKPVSPTLSAKGQASIVENWQVRRLTPTECSRLQGFPDGYCRIPWRGKSTDQCPDGPQYKALGNSMAVNVMEWIGRRIELVTSIEAGA